MERDIIIVGAGISGLTAAATFLKSGHSVRIYEQASELSEIGAGIQISANASAVLLSLVSREALVRVAYLPDQWTNRVFNTGEVLYTRELGSVYEKKYGFPYCMILRCHLHQLLVNTVLKYNNVSINLSAKATHFNESNDRVEVYFDNGSSASADVVIGADGIHSNLRRQIVSQDHVEYSGYAVWRILVDAKKIPSDLLKNESTTWVGEGKHAVTYRLDDGNIQSFVGAVKRNDWSDESWIKKYPWEELIEDFYGWHRDIQSILQACEKGLCYRWALLSRKSLETWRSQRVILIGDAAHPTLPFMAQGAAMGIESAALLGRYLELPLDLDVLLDSFQKHRMPRTKKIIADSAAMAKFNHQEKLDILRYSHQKDTKSLLNRDWIDSYKVLQDSLLC